MENPIMNCAICTDSQRQNNIYQKAPHLNSYDEYELAEITTKSISPPFHGGGKIKKREISGTILLLCSDEQERTELKDILESEYYVVRCVDWNKLSSSHLEDVSLILAVGDVGNPIILSCCRKLCDSVPANPIIFIDNANRSFGHRDVAMQYVTECLSKSPQYRELLLAALRHAMQIRRLTLEKAILQQHLGHPLFPVSITGPSVAAQTLRRQIEAFGKLDTTILITGDQGSGKNTVAQLVHQMSVRAKQPFLVIPCDSLPSHVLEAELFGWIKNSFEETTYQRFGKLQLFSEGTILLDNIECLSPFLQRKLLAFLQNQSPRLSAGVDAVSSGTSQVRIIASTRGHLPYVCAQKKFLEELFYLFRSMTIPVPPLRERGEDFPDLCNELLFRLSRQFGSNPPILSMSALQKLRHHNWPGNVHELEMVLYDAMSKAKNAVISESDIFFDPFSFATDINDPNIGLAGLTMADIERRAIIETIVSCLGNRAKAAQKLGISEKTIYNKIKQFKLRGVI